MKRNSAAWPRPLEKLVRDMTKSLAGLVVVLWLGLGATCQRPPPTKPVPHCRTLEEWRGAPEVRAQHVRLAVLEWGPVNELLDRYDYLEARCLATNAARGER